MLKANSAAHQPKAVPPAGQVDQVPYAAEGSMPSSQAMPAAALVATTRAVVLNPGGGDLR